MKKVLKWIGIGMGALIVLFIVLAIVVPTSDENPPESDGTNPESTHIPTKDAATSVPPTAAATPTPTLSPDVPWTRERYGVWGSKTFTNAGEALTQVGALFGAPLLDKETWRDEVNFNATTLINLWEEAQEVNPPPAFTDAHSTMLEALKELQSVGIMLKEFTALIEAGETEVSESFVAEILAHSERATALITLGVAQMNRANP